MELDRWLLVLRSSQAASLVCEQGSDAVATNVR